MRRRLAEFGAPGNDESNFEWRAPPHGCCLSSRQCASREERARRTGTDAASAPLQLRLPVRRLEVRPNLPPLRLAALKESRTDGGAELAGAPCAVLLECAARLRGRRAGRRSRAGLILEEGGRIFMVVRLVIARGQTGSCEEMRPSTRLSIRLDSDLRPASKAQRGRRSRLRGAAVSRAADFRTRTLRARANPVAEFIFGSQVGPWLIHWKSEDGCGARCLGAPFARRARASAGGGRRVSAELLFVRFLASRTERPSGALIAEKSMRIRLA